MPYIRAAIGFLATFSAKVSRALMSTSSQVPSGAMAERMASITSCGWVMSWMQSNVVTRSTRVVGGQRLSPHVVEVGVGEPLLGPLLLGPDQGVPGDVVPVRRGVRVRSSPGGGPRTPAPQPTSATGGADDSSLATTPSSAGQGHGHQEVPVPRLEGALDAGGALGAVGVVVVADARSEALGQLLEQLPSVSGRRPNMPMPNAGWLGSRRAPRPPRASGRRWPRRRQCARSWPPPGCGPLPHPPLVETAALGQLDRGAAARPASASARYRPSWSPRWIIPAVTAPSSLEKTRNA